MSNFWSIFIIVIVLINLIGCAWLLHGTRKNPVKDVAEGEKLKHSFDGIEELNTPLPRWWLWLFWVCLAFCAIYLFLYPGLGNFKGQLNWSQTKQHQQQEAIADKKYKPLFSKYMQTPVAKLAADPIANDMGRRLYANNCATCHGGDARGSLGFPNLRDKSWLYGNSPEAIELSILKGRNGMMPPMAAVIGGDAGVKAVVAYVRSLNHLSADEKLIPLGKEKFAVGCAMCHGANAKGNPALGAPNLTDGHWLYGSSEASISKTIREGRRGTMPAHEAILGKEKVHILAAYIYSFLLQAQAKD